MKTKAKLHLWPMVAAVLAVYVLSTASHRVVPVVAFMSADDWQTDANTASAEIYGWKLRDGCRPIGRSIVGWVFDPDHGWTEAQFAFVDSLDRVYSRPFGRQHFGRWEWVSDNAPTRVRLTIEHRCGDNGTRLKTTVIGPFNVGD